MCDGAPGLRDVHPNFIPPFVLDPNDNKLLVVCRSDEDN
jgi:hypothetical protein